MLVEMLVGSLGFDDMPVRAGWAGLGWAGLAGLGCLALLGWLG